MTGFERPLSTLLSHSDRGQRGKALQLWLNRLSSSMSLARQLDPDERPFSMLTHSSGTCQFRTFAPDEVVMAKAVAS